jgi:hypothetical protein
MPRFVHEMLTEGVYFYNVKNIRKILWAGTWTLTLIGVLLVLRRLGIMAGYGRYLISPRFPFDSGLRNFPVLTFIHIIPGLVFILLGPFQFLNTNNVRPGKSRFVFIIASYIIGISALVMPFITMPLGGLNEAMASSFFALYFLVSITRSLRNMYRPGLQWEWLLRAYAVGLAIATVRPIMALSFAFFGLRPQTFLGTAFWIGFSLHAIIAEVWINLNRREAQ